MRSRGLSTVVVGGAVAFLLICLVAVAASAPGERGRSADVVVSYREEGGIGGPRPSLVLREGRRAKVRLGGCTERFRVRRRPWKRLRAALRAADLPANAGDYPPPEGSADMITYVVSAGGHTVRIAPGGTPEYDEVMHDLEPPLAALNRVVAAGKRRMDDSCLSARRDPSG